MRKLKSIIPLALLSLSAAIVDALPTAENLHKMMAVSDHIDKRCPFADKADDWLNKRQDEPRVPVDTSGEHAFRPPNFENGDQRGLCPGLNALANHGYIPHNGIVSFGKAIEAVNEVFGMGRDLALLFSALSTAWGGNPLSLDPSFSIGGPTPEASNFLGNLGGIIGAPQGFAGTHNFIDTDSSNTREDLYISGDNSHLNMDLYMEWENMATDGIFTWDMMAERAKIRYDQSKQRNPYFYYGPITGLVVRNAAFIVNPRLYSNYSAEHPEGILTKEIIRDFHGIYGEEPNLTYRKGWERFPENWYKTPMDTSVPQLLTDIAGWVRQYPELANIGGNTGTVDSFTGIDFTNLTGGVFNSADLLEGNNLLCFTLGVLKAVSPNSLSSLYKNAAGPLKLLTDAIEAPMLDLACPAFEDLQMGGKSFWEMGQEVFPGVRERKSVL